MKEVCRSKGITIDEINQIKVKMNWNTDCTDDADARGLSVYIRVISGIRVPFRLDEYGITDKKEE